MGVRGGGRDGRIRGPGGRIWWRPDWFRRPLRHATRRCGWATAAAGGVAAGACAGSDGLIGGVHDAAVRLLHAAGASMPSSAVSLAATRAHVRFLSNNRSNLVAVSVILVIDGCWAKALPGVMPVPVAVMSLGFTFLPGGAAADPLSQVPL